jgi:uncharacterized protein
MKLFYSILLSLLPFTFQAELIDTFYGPIDVEEPVLLELIASPGFQRLKQVRQYGVSYYITHNEEYNRYDHSIGVLALLRDKKVPLKEQIAGLLHDVSHTAFSHVGDYLFPQDNDDSDYQTSVHEKFLEERGFGEILRKYDYKVGEMLPLEKSFPALEQPLPNLCADRIDYNIQGAYHQGFLTLEEAKEIFSDLQFIEGRWVGSNMKLMKKLSLFSLFMTRDCWGSATNFLASRLLAEALKEGLDLGLISLEDIQFGTDQIIWDCLMKSDNAFIKKTMNQLLTVKNSYHIVDIVESDLTIKSKFRGIDPWIIQEGKKARLTYLDPAYATQYEEVKGQMEQGWFIRFIK